MTETIENKRKRLIFRSWHRGTREMDLLLGRFAEIHVPCFSDDELVQYDNLLMENDPDLYKWYTGREKPPSNIHCDVLEKFINFDFSKHS